MRCELIKELVIPNGVREIAFAVFTSCTSLEYVELPDTVTSIDEYPFDGCTSLKSVKIMCNIKELPKNFLKGCDQLEYVELSDSIEVIGDFAFYNCSALTNIKLPTNLKGINQLAFYECKSLESITLPEGMMYIRPEAFYNCVSLGGIYIPETTTSISDSAFEGCPLLTIYGVSGSKAESFANLKEFPFSTEEMDICDICDMIVDGIQYIYANDRAFITKYQGTSKEVIIPDKVNGKTVIGMKSEAFLQCESIEKLSIHAKFKDIPEACFKLCPNLRVVELPEGLVNIEKEAFYGCSTLDTINFQDGLKCIKECAFEGTGFVNVVLPDTILDMEGGVFKNCLALEYIHFPANLTYLMGANLEGCSALKHVELPKKITLVGIKTFKDCVELESIKIPQGIVQIAEDAFSGCKKLKSVEISSPIKVIRTGAFYNCERLTRIYISDTVKTIESDAFKNCYFLVISAQKGSYAIDYAKENGIKYVEVDSDGENFTGDISSDVINGMGDSQELPIISENGSAIFSPEAVIEINHRHGNKNVQFSYNVVGKSEIDNSAMLPAINDAIESGGKVMNFDLVDSEGEKILFSSEENDGTVTITIPYTAPVSANKVTVYYITPDGTKKDMQGVYNPSTKTITFSTTHFSCFTIETDVEDHNKLDGHSWSEEYTVTKKATCTESGLLTYSCVADGCEATKEEVVEALGHEYSAEWTVDKEATCAEAGSKSHHCIHENCSEKADITVIPITEHAWDEGKITVTPTCIEKGERTYTCTNCSATKTGAIEALGHEYSAEWTVDKEATCTEAGSKSYHCIHESCSEKADITVIPLTEHAWNDGMITVAPTCIEKGERTYTCTNCSATKNEAIEALGHEYAKECLIDEKASYNQNGSKSHHCVRNGCCQTAVYLR